SEQFVAQIGEICELAVEGDAEPFPLAAVLPRERLSIAAVVRSAGRVAHVANGGAAPVLAHDALVLGLVVHAEGFDDRSNLLVGIEEFLAMRVVRAEAGR